MQNSGKPPGIDGQADFIVGNILPFKRTNQADQFEPYFTSEERAALRKMLSDFDKIRTACPTARRELSE